MPAMRWLKAMTGWITCTVTVIKLYKKDRSMPKSNAGEKHKSRVCSREEHRGELHWEDGGYGKQTISIDLNLTYYLIKM